MRAKTGTTGAKGEAANKIIPIVMSNPKPQSFVAARTRIGTTTKLTVTINPRWRSRRAFMTSITVSRIPTAASSPAREPIVSRRTIFSCLHYR